LRIGAEKDCSSDVGFVGRYTIFNPLMSECFPSREIPLIARKDILFGL
jgi:hypothetical protein